MQDVAGCSISVSGWCPRCEQPHVDRRYPGEMTLMFVPFFSCSWWVSFGAFEKRRVIFSVYCATLCEEIYVQYTFIEFQKMVAITLPAENVVFTFFGIEDPGWYHCNEECLFSDVK